LAAVEILDGKLQQRITSKKLGTKEKNDLEEELCEVLEL